MDEAKKALLKKYVLQGVIALLILAGIAALFLRQRAKERAISFEAQKFFSVADKCKEPVPENRLKEFLSQAQAARRDLEADPNHFNSWMILGSVKHTLCDFEGARDIWEYASSIRPKNALSFGNLGNLYAHELNDPLRAEANYLKAIENEEAFQASLVNVKDPPPFNITYYKGLHELYRYKFPQDVERAGKADDILLRGIEKVPSAVDLKTLLASYYRDSGNIEAAIRWFEEALKQKPDNAAVKAELERLKSLPKKA